jgi:predicted O-methyltransferase YrrM
MNKNIANIFNAKIKTPSDINEHLLTLNEYANKVNTVTEFGTRFGCSTWAFLNSSAKRIISYDLKKTLEVDELIQIAKESNIDYTFNELDTLSIEIENTDLLFIDTLHTYQQLSQELLIHAGKVNKYIILHDTITFGNRDMEYVGPISNKISKTLQAKQGLQIAIDEFLTENKEWKLDKHFTNNNGLTILEKIR